MYNQHGKNTQLLNAVVSQDGRVVDRRYGGKDDALRPRDIGLTVRIDGTLSEASDPQWSSMQGEARKMSHKLLALVGLAAVGFEPDMVVNILGQHAETIDSGVIIRINPDGSMLVKRLVEEQVRLMSVPTNLIVQEASTDIRGISGLVTYCYQHASPITDAMLDLVTDERALLVLASSNLFGEKQRKDLLRITARITDQELLRELADVDRAHPVAVMLACGDALSDEQLLRLWPQLEDIKFHEFFSPVRILPDWSWVDEFIDPVKTLAMRMTAERFKVLDPSELIRQRPSATLPAFALVRARHDQQELIRVLKDFNFCSMSSTDIKLVKWTLESFRENELLESISNGAFHRLIRHVAGEILSSRR